MSIKIKKRTGEIFDLPPDYIIETERNNPLFSKKGSQTVPISFQNTNTNRRLLEHAYRLDISKKVNNAIPVVIESGASQQSGLMVINSASDKLISANIGLDESEMYVNMGTTLLRNMNSFPPPFIAGGNSHDARVDAMLAHLTSIMKEQADADYCIFPIVLQQDRKEDGESSKTYLEFLNETQYSDINNPPNGAMGELLAWNTRILNRYFDGEAVLFDVPKGYGVSPFLKVWRLLELIFEHYNLSLENNPFKEHPQLKRMVVLNNTMDTILLGSLNYRDLMPDITITGFLDSLYNKFGLQYFANSNTRKVSLAFWKDILSSSNAVDYTKYKTEPPSIKYSQAKQLKLLASREIEGTEVKWNTFEEFLSAYEYQFTEFFPDAPFNQNLSSVYLAALRRYAVLDALGGKPDHMSSDFFDWDKKADLPYEEIKMNDMCVPMGSHGLWYLLYYLVGYKHLYSSIAVAGEAADPKQSTAKLAFAFAWGKTKWNNAPYNFNYFFASQDNCNEYGRFINDQNGKKYDISLTCHREDGLFNRWWKEYDAFLRHSNYEVDSKLKLPEPEIVNLKMHKTVLIDNQPFLTEQIKFQQNKLDSISDCKFRTLRLYQPFNLAEEQKILAYRPQKYYWRWEVERVPAIEAWLDENGIYYSIEGDRTSLDEGRRSLIWLPPSEEEYQNQSTRTFEYDYVVVWQWIVEQRTPVHAVVTFYPTLIED